MSVSKPSVRLQAYVPQEVSQALHEFCESRNLTLSAGVTAILAKELGIRMDDPGELRQELDKLRAELRMLKEVVQTLTHQLQPEKSKDVA